MKINSIVSEYIVDDVEETLHFYATLLGFKVVASEGAHDHLTWALLRNGSFRLSFKSLEKVNKEVPFIQDFPIGGTVSMVLQVSDIQLAYKEIKAKCELLNHPHLTACGMTEFSVKDPNGYFLTFEQPMN